MKGKKSKREIYDQNYYKAKELLLNPKFRRRISELKRKFKEFGCPIPREGFKTMKEYLNWNKNKFWKAYSDCENSKEYKDKILKITEGKQSWGSKEMLKIEKLKEKYLPPIYGQIFEDILEEFGIDRKDKGFDDFLEKHVFFNKNTYPTPLFSVRWIRSAKTNKMELFIQLYGHTRKEDILNNWDFITRDQKYLPEYTGKNKKWFTFERDSTLYKMYLDIKKERNGVQYRKQRPIDEEIYTRIAKRHPGLNLSTIRSIISKVKKFRAGLKGTD